MSKEFVFIFMIFCHIIDDYKLQSPVLNILKQKSWWEENAPDPLYKNDYIMGLIMHSLSWGFMIMLSISIYRHFDVDIHFIIFMISNSFIHGLVDDFKANRHKINLIQDQLIHIFQIIYTFMAFINGEI